MPRGAGSESAAGVVAGRWEDFTPPTVAPAAPTRIDVADLDGDGLPRHHLPVTIHLIPRRSLYYLEFSHMHHKASLAIATAMILQTMTAVASPEPRFNPSGPEAELFGAADGFPVGDRYSWRETRFLVGSYSRYDTIFPSNRVKRAATSWKFQRAEREPEIRYDFSGGRHTLDDYLAHFPVTGILLLHRDTILLERYQYGRTDTDRFTSASMAKSILSLLAGIAAGEGHVRSLGDHVDRYVPELQGTLYGETSLDALLKMSSGIEFEATVNGVKSSAGTDRLMDGMFTAGADPVALLAACRRRAYPVGTHFDYSSGDNEATGIALRRATGKSLADYLSEKIWQPIGAEADATWWVDTSGQELPAMGFNATVRDYARLGRLLAHDGAWDGRQLVPREYLVKATTNDPQDGYLAPGVVTPYYGYGHQFWIFPGKERMFVLRGTNSQYIFVDPRSKLVLVQTAVRSEAPNAENGKSETLALWLALVRQFGGAASR